jgi:uncharacterized protein DUF4252
MRTVHLILASMAAAALTALPAAAEGSTAAYGPGYVDGQMFRNLVDDNEELVEVNLDGPVLKALGKSKGKDERAMELIGNLRAVHAVIGTVKGPASSAFALVQQTDQKLAASGWQRITRIKDDSDWVSVLTHVTGDQIDGLVVLTFSSDDKELVFANLAGPIDLSKLGEIGDIVNVPGLENVPGAH